MSLLFEDFATGNKAVAEEPLKLLKPALETSKRAADLTQRLLAFSRKQALQPRTLDLNKLVTGIEDILRSTLGDPIRILAA